MIRVTLGDVCEKAGSNIAQKDLNTNEGEYPIYGAGGHIKNVDFYHRDKPYIAIVKDGAGIGRTMLLPEKSSVIGTMQYILLKEDSKVDLHYLYYAIVHMNLGKYFSGATIPHIYFKDYQKEPLNLPDMCEQQQIATIFEKLDALTAKRSEQLKNLDELVKSRFIELFGNPELNEKSWKVNTFGDICKVRQGLQIPISKRLTDFETGCYVYITVQYLHGGKEREYIKNPKSTVICTENDVLMTRTGNTGMVITGVEGVFHNNFFLIDFDRSRYDKEFLVQYLNMDVIQNDIRRRAGTSTIPDLNHGDFYKIMIYEPPLELQQQFAAFVAQVDKSKLAVQKSLQELETLKKSLMQQYFG